MQILVSRDEEQQWFGFRVNVISQVATGINAPRHQAFDKSNRISWTKIEMDLLLMGLILR